MKNTIIAVGIIVLLLAGLALFSDTTSNEEETEVSVTSEATVDTQSEVTTAATLPVALEPISHATFVMEWGDTVFYNDPVGGAEAFSGEPAPDIVLLSDTHGDHLDVETLRAVVTEEVLFIAPQAVVDELPEPLASWATVLNNGQTLADDVFRLSITAVPMYNLPEQGVEIRHEKGRGNGYLIEHRGERVYIAGDTADIPEMRSLENIDVAFVPMNLPYTMGVERAADGVLAFAPEFAIPYHYRTPEGFSDVERFRQLVNDANPDIEVLLLDWYPEAE